MTLRAFPIPDPSLARRQPYRPSRVLRAGALAVLLLAAASGVARGQNLIDNGDFDDDVVGWGAGAGSITHDGTEGSTSGPGSLSSFGQSGRSSASQCVGVLGSTTYSFGADFRQADGTPLNFCRVRIDGFDFPNCAGPSGRPGASGSIGS